MAAQRQSQPSAGLRPRTDLPAPQRYDDSHTFFQFVLDYAFLPQPRFEVAARGSKHSHGILHTLKKEQKGYWIAPRSVVLEAYRAWLADHGCSDLDSGIREKEVEDSLVNAGVPLKREKGGKDSWRYHYYEGKVDKETKPCCFGIAVDELQNAAQEMGISDFSSRITLSK